MKRLLSVFLLLFSLIAQGEVCFPKNNRLNPISNNKSINTIDELDFRAAIAEAKEIYAPIFKEKHGSDLVIEEKWEDNTVNAYAQQSGKTWKVSMFGGLARDPLVTRDGFSAVICHEIGHHIAGAPRKPGMLGNTWASNEGQSDYFATTKCLRRLWEKKPLENLIIYWSTQDEDRQLAKNACDQVYSNEEEAALCFRQALAGESLAKLLGSLGGNANVKFSTPDPTVATKTNHNHPKGQCRMDTYFQGALCDKDFNIDPSNSDASEGYCSSKDAYKIGLRPLCWFNPKEYGLDR